MRESDSTMRNALMVENLFPEYQPDKFHTIITNNIAPRRWNAIRSYSTGIKR